MRIHHGRRSVCLLLCSATLAQSGPGGHLTSAMQAAATPIQGETEHAIGLAGGYLVRMCGPNGRFVYSVNIRTGEQSRSYNIVRHAGAIYALGLLNNRKPSPEAVDAMVRASAFMRRYYMGPGPQPGQIVVWSAPFPTPSVADLGASGLGLVALTATEKARPRSIPMDEMQGLARFILFLERPDGSFIDKYKPLSGPDEDFESLYFPGEAVLGLIDLYELDHNKEWLEAAARALMYLARSRASLTEVPPDHWAMIATAKLWPYLQEIPGSASSDALIHHAEQVCRALMAGQITGTDLPLVQGSFDPNGRTAPAATRIEGILAASSFLSDPALKGEIRRCADAGIQFLLHAQLQSGPLSGGLPDSIVVSARLKGYVRIDFVQHALGAWL